MSGKHKVRMLAGVVAAVVVVAIGAGWREPSFKGRGLTSWLKQCYDASLEETQKISQAQQAINAMGAKRVVPVLLDMLKAEDGPVHSWIIRKNDKWHVRALRLREAAEIRQMGVAGFEALGTNAASAVAELTSMLDDTNASPVNVAFVALRNLIYIGMPAEKSVCRALTNRNSEIRSFATAQVCWVTDDIVLYLKRLEGPLNDADATVRFAAVQALGFQTTYPDETLPLLVRALNDPAQNISGYAAKFLGDLGTNGIKAFNALSNVVETGNAYMAAHALRSLVSIAPDRALPMVFEWLQSTNQDHRARATWLLGQFPQATPQILGRLKQAAKDADPKVVHNATDSLKKYRQKEKDQGSYRVFIKDEPSYGGKLLGDWLKRRPDVTDPPDDTKRAVRELGTNAIPVLLARLVYVDQKYGLYDYDASMESVGGFCLLGPTALSALPRLEELINGDDENVAVFALVSSCNMGSNAVPVVTRALTNNFANVRNEALHYLTEGPLTAFPDARKNVVPDVIKMLRDPEESNRMNATNALKELDPKAAATAGVK